MLSPLWNLRKNALYPVILTFLFNMSKIIRIKHGFTCINIGQIQREMLETEGKAQGFQGRC